MTDHRIRIDLAAEARDAMSNARGGGSNGSPASANAAPASGVIPDIGATLSDLTTAIKELSRNVERQTGEDRKKKPEQDRILTPQQRGAEAYAKIADSIKTGIGKMVPDFVKGSAGAISNAFGMAKGAAGGVMGSMGAAVPIAGAMIGAASYLIQKTRDVGEAYIATAGAQKGSAGLGGTQAGGFGYLVGGEYSEFIKQRSISAERMQGGELSTNSQNYMKAFGVSGAEMGRTAGTFALAGGDIDKALAGVTKYGITTGQQAILGQVTQSLSEAVKEGVNASDMADDMAGAIASRTAFSPNKSYQSGAETVRAIGGVAAGVNKGSIGGFASFQYYQTAKGMLAKELEAGGGKSIDSLKSAGIIGDETISQFKKTGTIDPYVMDMATKFIAGENKQGVSDEFMKKIISGLGGSGTYEARQAQAYQVISNIMPELNLNPQKFSQEFARIELGKSAENESKGILSPDKSAELKAKDAAAQSQNSANFTAQQAAGGGASFMASALEINRNYLKLSSASAQAALAVYNFEVEMNRTMAAVAPLAESTFKTVNSAALLLADGLNEAITKIKDIVKMFDTEAAKKSMSLVVSPIG